MGGHSPRAFKAGSLVGYFEDLLDDYSHKDLVAALEEANARRLSAEAVADDEEAAEATVTLAARAVRTAMALDEAWKQVTGRHDGPAQVFLGSFDPSITFEEARLSLTEEVVAAFEEMKTDLYTRGYFRDRSHLLDDANTLIGKLRERLAALPA